MIDRSGDDSSSVLWVTVIALVSSAFVAIVALHMLRTDMDPTREVMSAYANGSFGIVMTMAFYALGIAALLMASRLPAATHASRLTRVIAALLAIAGLGLILAGVFEVERSYIPDTIEEVIHSDAAITAFVLLVAAMLLFTMVCRRDPRWHSFFTTTLVLAVVATIGAGFSPIADKTPWTGIAQRTLGATIFAWLLLVAYRIQFRLPAAQADRV